MTDGARVKDPYILADEIDETLWRGWVADAFRENPDAPTAATVQQMRLRFRRAMGRDPSATPNTVGADAFRATWSQSQAARRDALAWFRVASASAHQAATSAEAMGALGVGLSVSASMLRAKAETMAEAAAEGAASSGVVVPEDLGDRVAGALGGVGEGLGLKGLGWGLGIAAGLGALLLFAGPALGAQAGRAVRAARG